MKAEDLLPFDPAIVPWPTIPDAWALCLVPEPECRVWVEHDLIRAVLVADSLNPDNVANIHGVFTHIGAKVAVLLVDAAYALSDGGVRAIRFTANPTEMRVGRFGGETFVFLPREEFES